MPGQAGCPPDPVSPTHRLLGNCLPGTCLFPCEHRHYNDPSKLARSPLFYKCAWWRPLRLPMSSGPYRDFGWRRSGRPTARSGVPTPGGVRGQVGWSTTGRGYTSTKQGARPSTFAPTFRHPADMTTASRRHQLFSRHHRQVVFINNVCAFITLASV